MTSSELEGHCRFETFNNYDISHIVRYISYDMLINESIGGLSFELS